MSNDAVGMCCRKKLLLLLKQRYLFQQQVHKKTLSPEFSEEFIFDVPTQQLAGLTLEILVYDFDHFSRDECIGQVHLPLLSIDFTEKVTLWKGISVYNKKQLKVSVTLNLAIFP